MELKSAYYEGAFHDNGTQTYHGGMGFIFAPWLVASLISSGASAGSAVGLNLFNFNRVNNQQKAASTNVANEVEQNMKALVAQYFNKQDRTTLDKQRALAYFDSLWQELTQRCSQVGGNAANNCIKDRSKGGKWDWFAYYRTPIENDNPPSPSVSQTVSTDLGIPTVNSNDLIKYGMMALVGVGLIMFVKGK
jgi:BMFP domain-containing protein YqiC